jgi:hypothetical protein
MGWLVLIVVYNITNPVGIFMKKTWKIIVILCKPDKATIKFCSKQYPLKESLFSELYYQVSRAMNMGKT